jgi:hypothetical protein
MVTTRAPNSTVWYTTCGRGLVRYLVSQLVR